MILQDAEKNKKSVLNFENKKVASVSFFDESIGKLSLEGWKLEDLSTKLKLENLHRLDKKVLDRIILDRFSG